MSLSLEKINRSPAVKLYAPGSEKTVHSKKEVMGICFQTNLQKRGAQARRHLLAAPALSKPHSKDSSKRKGGKKGGPIWEENQ